MITTLKNEIGRKKLLSIYGKQTINTMFPINYCLSMTLHNNTVFLSMLEEYHSNPGTHVPVWCLRFAISELQVNYTAIISRGWMLWYGRLDCFDCCRKTELVTTMAICCPVKLCLFYNILDAKMLCFFPHTVWVFIFTTPFKPHLFISSTFPHPHIWNFRLHWG